MDLQPMTMQKEAAEAAFRDYRAAFMAERNRIDGELMRGYKALKDGKQLIRLSETITAGGVDEMGRPRLTIARADEAFSRFERGRRDGQVTFTTGPRWGNRFVSAADRRFVLPPGTLPTVGEGDPFDDGSRWMADMPIIPPRLRPRHDLKGYHVLWEPVWRLNRTRAPGDPALLKRIGGDLFAVLAMWDLTDLERAVLEMRG
jgi:hypothetical protein